MAITKTKVQKKYVFGGLLETGKFAISGTSTEETVTADTTSGEATIAEVLMWGFASNADTAIDAACDVAANAVKITTATTDDAGHYWLFGRTA